MKKVFLSFGSGRFLPAASRIEAQALAAGIFDEVKIYTPEKLYYEFPEFLVHLKYIIDNPCGYGHWLWKPFLIYKTLLKLNEGDVLFYLDSGCEIVCDNASIFNEYLTLLGEKDEAIAFEYRGYESMNMEYWATRQLIDLFTSSTAIDLSKKKQIWAGALGFRRCECSLAFTKKWYDLCASTFPRDELFIGKIHDQAIFTFLSVKYPITLLKNAFELDYQHRALKYHPACWQIAKKQPFLAMRNESSYSYINSCHHRFYEILSKMLYALNTRSYGGTEWLARNRTSLSRD